MECFRCIVEQGGAGFLVRTVWPIVTLGVFLNGEDVLVGWFLRVCPSRSCKDAASIVGWCARRGGRWVGAGGGAKYNSADRCTWRDRGI